MRLLLISATLLLLGWWQTELISDSVWHGRIAPLLVFVGLCGVPLALVMRFPAFRRKSEGGAGTGGDGPGDGSC